LLRRDPRRRSAPLQTVLFSTSLPESMAPWIADATAGSAHLVVAGGGRGALEAYAAGARRIASVTPRRVGWLPAVSPTRRAFRN
jgi:hypothetical protein